ncbi:MAG: universal stress protein [Ectothiorhodospiraceae bacterium]|nr:universal stress protein [Chromatiales bacterium]MCP5153766.1 universal stress protein [Ectothiorhodospiraceae bacterium]
MTEKILVPIDGSDGAFKALDVAVDLVRSRGGTLSLLHVVPSGSLPRGLEQWAQAEHVNSPPQWLYEQGVADALLDAATDRVRDRGADVSQTYTERGDAAEHIVDLARREKFSMVVMGTRGLSKLEGLVIGSVAHKVAHLAPCSVVSVR